MVEQKITFGTVFHPPGTSSDDVRVVIGFQSEKTATSSQLYKTLDGQYSMNLLSGSTSLDRTNIHDIVGQLSPQQVIEAYRRYCQEGGIRVDEDFIGDLKKEEEKHEVRKIEL